MRPFPAAFAGGEGKFFREKGKFKVDIREGSGYNNQAVFFRGRTFAAVLELVDRPA